MNVIKWRPFGEMTDFNKRVNRLFHNDFFADWDREGSPVSGWSPSTDIYENKDEYVFKMELPGLSKDDITIDFHGDTITVKGDKKEENEIKKEDYHRVERCYGNFIRSFTIPKNVDQKKIKANMKNGVLELKVPKQEEAKPKSIPITIQ